jgi:NADH-ubiquinone oxidoreductase chain 1
MGLSIIFIYIVLRINVYPTLIAGWRSNRKYAIIGSLRAIAQTISYEVSFALIILFYLTIIKCLNLIDLSNSINFWNKIFLYPPIIGLWLISCLAETNRTPFDFAEGESELVSGFNIEYGRVGFALIFIAEYARIFFISLLFVTFFLSNNWHRLLSYFLVVLLVSLWVWVRTTFPRHRFDLLINIAWKSFLPVSLFLLGMSLTVTILDNSLIKI